MKVKDSNLLTLFSLNGTEFVIPVYQRNYAWGKEQCGQLLDDILDVSKSNKQHFLGTMTYIVHSNTQGVGSEFVIIDGQQRITTLTLLLKALQHNSSIKNNEGLKKMIDNYLSFGFADKIKLRLKPIKKDREAFECVMGERWTQFSGKSNIIDNFRFLLNETRHLFAEQIEQILNAFARLQTAEVILDKSVGDDPQMVFERINATGLHLTGLDLIRNFLMMEYKPEEQERLFQNFWVKIEDTFNDEKIIDKFIKTYLRIYKFGRVKEDDYNIYTSFKNLREEHFDKNSEKILEDMVKFARIYKIIIDKNTPWHYESEEPKQKRILREKINFINYLDFGVAFPFTMRVIDDFESGKLDFENFDEILNLLISYYVRRSICGLLTAALGDVVYGMYKKLDGNISANGVARFLGQRAGNEVFPNAQMLLRGFENSALKSKKVITLVFYKIEQLDNHEVPELENLNIEHFYPQTPTSQWREMLGDEATNLEQNYLDTLGNLTLLNAGLNSKASNKSFEDKVKMYEDKGSLHLNRYFSNCDKWDIDEIKKRAKWLFERFKEIEIFKDIGDEFRRTPELITLENDWTYLKPHFVKFPNGDEKSVSSVQKVVETIIEYLATNHADSLEMALRQNFSFIHFGQVEQKPVRSVEIDIFGECKFICNAGAESLRPNLKKLVEACGLEPSEFEIMTL